MERTRMNTKRSVTWGLLAAAAACVAVAAMPGCELLVNFDRSKIPTDDGSVGDDVESPDAPASPDGAVEGSTATPEAGADATSTPTPDAGDSGQAAPETGAPDTGVDTGIPDTGIDAPGEVDTGVDSGPDAVADSGSE
jgi:hypothetical protein